MRGKAWAVVGLMAVLGMGANGCASKNFVRNRVAPLVDKTNQLDGQTAETTRQIRATDDRAQSGIAGAQGAADAAKLAAQLASAQAQTAQTAANEAVHRADSLEAVVNGLDHYKPAGEAAVTFAFDKARLDAAAQQQLDRFGATLGTADSYILEVTGGTDSVGGADYNYQLSQRRAEAVVQFLASNYGVAPHRFYLIGIGKDREVASNRTPEGRQQNRRVQVRLLVAGDAR